MKDVNAHICPTCGGNLSIDVERQVYVCPYCGVTFDYDYFREESVLGIAAQSLKNNEFDSANRAYDFMLEKEPDNFEALRGKALVAMNITKISDICNLDIYSKINYESACKEIDIGIESSKPSDREYFTVMKDIVDAGHEYIGQEDLLKTQSDERKSTIYYLNEIVKERDTICIYSSPRFRPKKAVILTVFCYILICLLIFLGYKYVTRNPYSQAEDLSKYETEQTDESVGSNYYPYSHNDFNDTLDALSNYMEYQKALEREEQRKINYVAWEESHKDSGSNLIWIMGIATVFYVSIVFVLFMYGRFLNAEISKRQAQVDEQDDKIKNREERLAELKDGIDQGYNRLCELHPVSE